MELLFSLKSTTTQYQRGVSALLVVMLSNSSALRYMRHAFGVFWSCNSLHPPPSNKEDEPFSADETGGLP